MGDVLLITYKCDPSFPFHCLTCSVLNVPTFTTQTSQHPFGDISVLAPSQMVESPCVLIIPSSSTAQRSLNVLIISSVGKFISGLQTVQVKSRNWVIMGRKAAWCPWFSVLPPPI